MRCRLHGARCDSRKSGHSSHPIGRRVQEDGDSPHAPAFLHRTGMVPPLSLLSGERGHTVDGAGGREKSGEHCQTRRGCHPYRGLRVAEATSGGAVVRPHCGFRTRRGRAWALVLFPKAPALRLSVGGVRASGAVGFCFSSVLLVTLAPPPSTSRDRSAGSEPRQGHRHRCPGTDPTAPCTG